MKKFVLQVSAKEACGEGACTVTFKVPEEDQAALAFAPGQFITLVLHLDGKEARRCYSICSSPLSEGELSIGVKRVEGGLVSNHINDHLQVGDTVEVLAPEGRFTVTVDPDNYKTYYLLAAGSGITPVLSILKTVLQTEADSHVHLVYGNRSWKSTMFLGEIDALEQEFPERLSVTHVLSRQQNGWSDLWNRDYRSFRKGRIDKQMVKAFVDDHPPVAQDCVYYICGPGPMIDSTITSLQAIDVPDERIFVERFSGEDGTAKVETPDVAQLQIEGSIKHRPVEVQAGKTLLRAMLDAGVEAPYSCEGGVCSTCQCRLIEGEVHMKNNLILTEKELEKGMILTCQSLPLTERIRVQY